MTVRESLGVAGVDECVVEGGDNVDVVAGVERVSSGEVAADGTTEVAGRPTVPWLFLPPRCWTRSSTLASSMTRVAPVAACGESWRVRVDEVRRWAWSQGVRVGGARVG